METTPKADKLKYVYCTPCNSVESSPFESNEKRSNQKLSASLKERLKRSRRSFTAPIISVAKRLCVDEEEDDQHIPADCKDTVNNPPQDTKNVDTNRNAVRSASERVPGPTRLPSVDLVELRHQLKQEVREKMETLRRLKMVQMYRSKNDLTQLQILIDKWRSCVQDALYELQTDLPMDGRKASLSHIIDHFGLDDTILHYDRTEEDFTT